MRAFEHVSVVGAVVCAFEHVNVVGAVVRAFEHFSDVGALCVCVFRNKSVVAF
jgi:hypothetical protein